MNPLELIAREQIILASASPRRQQLLKLIGLKFQVLPSSIEERYRTMSTPGEYVKAIAMEKAQDVARRVKHGLIIGADTIVVLDDQILGKPENREQAINMLRSLSGRTHQVFTGFALVHVATKRAISEYEMTLVRFRRLFDWEIQNYVATGAPLDKAGAYGIQDQSALFADRIEGCFYNVVGFPLTKFYLTLSQFLSEK